MKTYARYIDGQLVQLIPPAVDGNGVEVPITIRFPSEVVAQLVEYEPPVPLDPTHDELVELAKQEMRTQRQPIISVLDGLQVSAVVVNDMPKAQLIEAAKQALRDITSTDLSACVTYDDMRTVIKARYLAMVMAAPSLQLAFSEALK